MRKNALKDLKSSINSLLEKLINQEEPSEDSVTKLLSLIRAYVILAKKRGVNVKDDLVNFLNRIFSTPQKSNW